MTSFIFGVFQTGMMELDVDSEEELTFIISAVLHCRKLLGLVLFEKV